MGKVLQIPFRGVHLLLAVKVVNFDGDAVTVRGCAGDLTLEAEVDGHVWEDAGGSFGTGASLVVELV